MIEPAQVCTREVGQLRLFLPLVERRKGGLWRLFGKPLYQEIIHAAKAEGILNATAQRVHCGYSGDGRIEHDRQDLPNPHLTLCVELIGGRHELEAFCSKHPDLLQDKVVVYDKLEHWEVGAANVAQQA
jgi:PII-like signaling protein